ncbi:GGDEF domain-containing protein [Methyloceanibacter caenitepidi]|uniref:Sensory box/GGDEF family protein n=1 Tax=Methyloceanibacter caenitepidi TaxID=1384459 RepID=A0A0A8K4T2_9HYPH|nr:GGDEF domain-containing protein [Methyloceanibacter caenitepidi]BAQ17801.1 sensory box/GGDEF family protein [Methyloceanibacter caenitepidi]
MTTRGLRPLIRSIADNPRPSIQDALLLASVLLVGALLALQYNLFWFSAELSDPQRKISLAEAMALTVLLALCICAFAVRRLREVRYDTARRAVTRSQMRQLRTLASHDSLTGLANRRELDSALAAAIASAASGRRHAFFMIDLNGFKRINDVYGHAMGDRVLQAVAGRFQSAARPSDLLARLGGDEFALLSYDVDHDTARAIGQRMMATLDSEIRVGGRSHEPSASIGVALIPQNGSTPEEIIHHADIAMYRAKGEDKTALVFFEPPAAIS